MTVLAVGQAEQLAERTLTAIDAAPGVCSPDEYATDRERVASDLEGLRECEEAASRMLDRREVWSRDVAAVQRAARRFSDGLLRTARLYGVEL